MILKKTVPSEAMRIKHVFRMSMLCKICLIVLCVLAAHLGLIYYSRYHNRLDFQKTNLIIDTDAGSDDALAILLALSIPDKVQVLAITCTYGNTWLNNVEANVLKILTVANYQHIPVYSGADKPLIHNYTATDFFGKDGMGDFAFDKKILASVNRAKHAAQAMIDLVKQHPGQVSIVTLGPATNVALAASLDPNFSKNVKQFYVMGSSPSRVGFNFALDPETTVMLLDTLTNLSKLVISSSAVPPKQMLTKDWRLNVFGKLDSERVKFMNDAEAVVLRRLNYWPAADSIAMATILWPELVTDSQVGRMTSDACDPIAGSVKFQQKASAHNNNVQLVTGFNVTAFGQKLLEHLA